MTNQPQSAGKAAFKRGSTLDATRFYMGSLMSILAPRTETGGQLAIMEAQVKPGNEPPPHIHEWENEVYYVLKGAIEFYCDDQIINVGPGEIMFIPQGKAHAMYIRSPRARLLIVAQATTSDHSTGIDQYFIDMSEPATSLDLPTGQATYATTVDPSKAIKVAASHGVYFLSRDEMLTLLPQYPGFGVSRELV
ncbi:MAG: cupin domain-containing protein [Bacteroidetes bacterium]|nr:cupin domain-containing protein [Fibrella sp.]